MPSNCFSKPMATASAEFELRKEWDLDSKGIVSTGSHSCALLAAPCQSQLKPKILSSTLVP